MSKQRDADGRVHDPDLARKPTRIIDPSRPTVDPNARPAPDRPPKEGHTILADLPQFVKSASEGTQVATIPVVGWLVVVDGPGKGHALSLGYGKNALGRAAGSRVALTFGDREISSDQHAYVHFDARSRKFYVQHGTGTNLTRLDGAVVDGMKELRTGQVIEVGRTHLRFVALCGPDFAWADSEP